MSTDLTEIDGVGPSYADDLEDAGYGSAADVADADPDDVDDILPTTSGERLVENAQHVIESNGDDDTDDEDEYFEFEPGFSPDQERHLIAALVNEEVNARKRNNSHRLDSVQEAVEDVRTGEPYTFTLDQLSTAYRATNQLESQYRGERGLASFVSEIRDLKQFFQNARQDNWPDN